MVSILTFHRTNKQKFALFFFNEFFVAIAYFNMTTTGISRIEQKLRASLETKDFYEAHQLYRTLYFRYTAQKKFNELKTLLFNGASEFLRLCQLTSGADLAMLYVDILTQSASPVDESILDKVELLYSLIPAKNENVNRDIFANNALNWTIKVEPNFPRGHPRLHRRFALILWHEKNYQAARRHFLLNDDGEACASFLIEYHLFAGYRNEADLFIAQAVFQFLCHKNKPTANSVFYEYTQKHPDIGVEGPPFVRPLLNFVWLLLLCIDTGKVSFYTILVEKYQPCLQRDPNYIQYLDKIGQVFFGLPPPVSKRGKMSMFDSLLKNLLTEDDDAVDSDVAEFSNPVASSSNVNANFLTIPNGDVIEDETLD